MIVTLQIGYVVSNSTLVIWLVSVYRLYHKVWPLVYMVNQVETDIE